MIMETASGTALVMGAGGGIGRQAAIALARHGATSLIAADFNQAAADETVSIIQTGFPSMKLHAAQFDIRQEASIEALVALTVAKCDRIDIFVNAAGIGAQSVQPLVNTPLAEFEDLDRVHNIGTFMSMQAVLRVMLAQESRQLPIAGLADGAAGTYPSRGSIVIISSLASEGGFLNVAPYIAAKHAVKGLVTNAALENARKGIRVNAVSPSYVSGPMIDKLLSDAPALGAEMLADLPLGRLAQAAEVGETVAFLAGSASSYINGTSLVHDGGASKALARGDYDA